MLQDLLWKFVNMFTLIWLVVKCILFINIVFSGLYCSEVHVPSDPCKKLAIDHDAETGGCSSSQLERRDLENYALFSLLIPSFWTPHPQG